MDRFVMLRHIIRFGVVGSQVLAIALGIGSAWLLWGSVGWMAVPIGVFAAALTYVLAKSYVEIVTIVMEMVH